MNSTSAYIRGVINFIMPTRILFKATKAAIAVYAPLQNIAFCISMQVCGDAHTAFTSLPYVLAIDIDVLLLWFLTRCFGFCRLYELAILNPFIWTTLMVVTPYSWNPTIAALASICSAVLVMLLIGKWYNKKRINYNVIKL